MSSFMIPKYLPCIIKTKSQSFTYTKGATN